MPSDYRETNITRKLPLDSEDTPSHNRKKNVRRWCRGKIGRKHEYIRQALLWQIDGHKSYVMICKNCGRRNWQSVDFLARLRELTS